MSTDFDQRFEKWAKDACKNWGYPEPTPEYYAEVYAEKEFRVDTQNSVVSAINEGLVVPRGMFFEVKDARVTKGPPHTYSWFGKNRPPKPCPNWEYFVHIAEFVRYHHIAKKYGLKALFEFDAMDIALYNEQEDRIVLCCEVKRKPEDIQALLAGLDTYQRRIGLLTDERGNDPLSKAKYIKKWRPDYLSLVAVGERREFRVEYPQSSAFRLIEGPTPWV